MPCSTTGSGAWSRWRDWRTSPPAPSRWATSRGACWSGWGNWPALIFRHLPTHHKPLNRWYLNAGLPLYCRRATHIIAISECTRRDLIAAYGLPPEKITVIHEAADPRFRPQPPEAIAAVRARYVLPDRYLIFVGTIEPRKNLKRLLTVFEAIHAQGLSDGLVIVGRRGWLYDDFFAALRRWPVARP